MKNQVLANIGGQASLGFVPVNSAGDKMTGCLTVSSKDYQFRAICGDYGVMLRNDGAWINLLQTAAGDTSGGFNNYRPFAWSLTTGSVSIDGGGIGTQFGGRLRVGNVNTFNNAYITIPAPSVPIAFTSGSQAWQYYIDTAFSFNLLNQSNVGVVLGYGASSWASSSSRALKDEIETYSVLNRLSDYRAVSYIRKANGIRELGVIAEEQQNIFPELVVGGETPSVTYDRYGSLALMAVKELLARVCLLESRLLEIQAKSTQ